MILNIILALVVCSLTYALWICIKRISFLVDSMEELNESLDTCLDVLADAHAEIAKCAGEDVMSDDPIVRRVVGAVFQSKNAILKVVNTLSSFEQTKPEEPIK